MKSKTDAKSANDFGDRNGQTTNCDQSRSWWPFLLLALIVVTSGAFRLIRIDLASLTRDEAFSWRLVQYNVPELIQRTGADVHPPLYYLALKVWTWSCGTSVASMRIFSALFGVASVVMAYRLAFEAFALSEACKLRPLAIKQLSALAAAGLLTIHSLQIDSSRTIRMYSLGVFLALLSSRALLRARLAQTKRASTIWWAVYGLSMGLFCLTHNFALLTFAAQVLFLAMEWLQARRARPQQDVRPPTSGMLASVLGATLFIPWIPFVISQIREVRTDYWIPHPDLTSTMNALVEWTTGIHNPTSFERWLILSSLGAIAIAVTRWKDRAGCFFAAQSIVPWLSCLAIGALMDRPILQLRYMVFSQVAFFCLVAVVLLRSNIVFRGYLLAVITSSTAWTAVEYFSNIPTRTSAIVATMEFVAQHHKPGDVILASSQRTVNQLRYYSSRSGMSGIRIRCVLSHNNGGHVVHLASLTDDEIISRQDWARFATPRVWRIYDSNEGVSPLPLHMTTIIEEQFTDRESHYVAMLHIPDQVQP